MMMAESSHLANAHTAEVSVGWEKMAVTVRRIEW